MTSGSFAGSTGSVSTGNGTPQLQRVQAHLWGVSAPFSLLTGSVRSVRVASATATASLSYAELATSLRARVPQVRQLQLGDAGNGAIAITAVVTALGVTLPVTSAAVMTLDGSHLRLAVDPNALTGQPATTRALLAQLLTVTLNVPHLPYGLTVTAVTPSADGLQVAARTGSITLQLG